MFKTISSILSSMFFLAIVGIILAVYGLWYFGQGLPDYMKLSNYEPSITTRLYAGDGSMMKEYAYEKRIFVPIDTVPEKVKQAFIAAEDQNFYSHRGIDLTGIARAIVINLKNIGRGRRLVGASTITQQVAKNFLLSSEVSYVRKIKEAILAVRIEHAFNKTHILELYLNEIYLGNRSYGVAAASLNYFGKGLSDLTLSEIAYLAALPKGPNNYNPKTKYDAAIERRNWVIDRMVEEGFVSEEEAELAKMDELVTFNRENDGFAQDTDYFSEEVRREVVEKFGEESLYESGLLVRTSLDPDLQKYAVQALKKGIEEYDLRHGYRGAITRISVGEGWAERLAEVEIPKIKPINWKIAVVLNLNPTGAVIGMLDETTANIPMKNLEWARKNYDNQTVGPKPTKPADVLAVGDVIYVRKEANDSKDYLLEQIPNVEGSIVALNPHTGRVLAMAGGYDFNKSQFNRATQAKRQMGSAFKPFVYLAAFDKGYSPSDLILDAPFVLDQGYGQPKWKPENYSTTFYGPTTLRMGVEKSRNLMTVRLAQEIGMDTVVDYAKRFGINDNLPELLSMSLGAGEAKLLDVVAAYGMLVNGGKKIETSFIDRIQDRTGKTIFKTDERECPDCKQMFWTNQDVPQIEDNRVQVTDPMSAYQIVSVLQGVVQRGTGVRLRNLGKTLAGKTGTTNHNNDAWFVGFTPDLAVGVYVGFDTPSTLGKFETGSRAASPIVKYFLEKALKNKKDTPFRIPNGMKLIKINHLTGLPAKPGDKDVIMEAFKPDTELKEERNVIGGDVAETPESQEVDDVRIGAEY